jgi:hypothetical protein
MVFGPRAQAIAGWVIVAIAFVHFAVTFIDYDAPSLRALWFVGSGFALLLIGGLNVVTGGLTDERFVDLRDLRLLTLTSDVCGIVLGALYVLLTHGTQPQGPVLVLLFAVTAALQLKRSTTARH